MEAIASYVLKLCCGAVICALILSITGSNGPGGRLRVMLCGLFLAFLAISPLRELDLDELRYTDPGISAQAERITQAGTAQAKEAMAAIIKDQCGAYILNKAAELELSLTVELTLDPDSGAPVSAILSGSAAPYEKEVLSDYITQTLGIERSGIQWNP